MVAPAQARYSIGECIHHRLFDYRGVILDVDPVFLGTEAWYQMMARSQPPKNEPWYHVLVDGTDRLTYVSEQNLEPDLLSGPIEHPLIQQRFSEYSQGRYRPMLPRH